jgi:hypothetical protein
VLVSFRENHWRDLADHPTVAPPACAGTPSGADYLHHGGRRRGVQSVGVAHCGIRSRRWSSTGSRSTFGSCEAAEALFPHIVDKSGPHCPIVRRSLGFRAAP